MSKFIKVFGAASFALLGMITPMIFVLSVQNGNKFAASLLGATTFIHWVLYGGFIYGIATMEEGLTK